MNVFWYVGCAREGLGFRVSGGVSMVERLYDLGSLHIFGKPRSPFLDGGVWDVSIS